MFFPYRHLQATSGVKGGVKYACTTLHCDELFSIIYLRMLGDACRDHRILTYLFELEMELEDALYYVSSGRQF
jgi:hypothetical protein